jgi:hypothetical protein
LDPERKSSLCSSALERVCHRFALFATPCIE